MFFPFNGFYFHTYVCASIGLHVGSIFVYVRNTFPKIKKQKFVTDE